MKTQTSAVCHGLLRSAHFLCILLLLLCGPALACLAAPAARSTCVPQSLEGEVHRGESWQHALTPSLVLKMEAVSAGWMVRVLPTQGPRPLHDAAELANPPYRSPTPILISTDFAFRAQDAVAWNPRTFRFFTTPEQTVRAEAAYQASLRDPSHPAAAAALFPLLASAPEASLTIVDAEISGGTANQTRSAAAVASHFEQTAHTVRSDAQPTPLGTLFGLRFRIAVPPLGPGCSR